ncbi:LysR substrate-binding domain-containing protein [Agrobacterium tumefaciens]|uniref:LysR substrate-binding domain-containing protein n=1 Tax=Agrobacterium tumefaciens TaxID=358 RepID=UPI002FDBC0FE
MAIQSRQVEAFRAVMLTGSMTAAAEMLGITQPAISRLIRDFEVQLALRLFERKGYQSVPTPDAITLFEEVKRSFVGLARISDMARAIKANLAGTLGIAAMPVLMSGALPRFVAGFMRDRPNLHISLAGPPSHLVLEAVTSGQADLGYAEGPFDQPGFDIEIMKAGAVVIMPAHHRLACRTVVDAVDLAGEPIVGTGMHTLYRSWVDAALANVPHRIVVEASLSQIACLLVSEGVGLSVVSPYAAEEFLGRGLVAKTFTPRIEAGFVSVRSRQRPMSALASTFHAEFLAHARRWGS